MTKFETRNFEKIQSKLDRICKPYRVSTQLVITETGQIHVFLEVERIEWELIRNISKEICETVKEIEGVELVISKKIH